MGAHDCYEEHLSANMNDLDEAEETLSLCDLPIYSKGDDTEEDLSNEDQSSSSSSEQDYFEFFSEEWNTNTSTSPAENIIFCGKLIPYKQPALPYDTQKLESNEQIPQKQGLFRWNFKLFNKSKTSRSSTGAKSRHMNMNQSKESHNVSSSKSWSLQEPEKYGYDTRKGGVSVQRVSILRSPTKSRWYLLMFGSARLPTEMDLSNIRNRQSRRSRSMVFPLKGGSEKTTVNGSRGNGLWGLLRALGCGGHHHPKAVVKA